MDDAAIHVEEGTRRDRRWLAWAAPIAVGVAMLVAWEATVRLGEIPKFKLAAPSDVAKTMHEHWEELSAAWAVTLKSMGLAIVAAVVTGVGLAALFASSRVIETSLFPYAIILQVTPLVAVAPFLVMWFGERVWLAQLISAWIVAFFPILSNTAIGLRQADPGLHDLFTLYRATRWQRLRLLLAPSALPFFLAGLKISANMALVGSIVAEFAIGPNAAESVGLATLILASQFRMDTSMMFAALALVSFTGIAIFFAVELLSRVALGRWHDSSAAKS